MFEMQVRCVWVILNNQVTVNFSTNCKCRHIQYICRFLTIRFPLLHCPKVQEMAFQRLQISKFHGEACPRTPLEISRLRRSIFAPLALGKQSQKSLHPPLIAIMSAKFLTKSIVTTYCEYVFICSTAICVQPQTFSRLFSRMQPKA